MYAYGSTSLANIESVDNRLQLICHRAIEIMNNRNENQIKCDFGISSGLRTRRQQIDLFEQGLSKCDGVHNISPHQRGMAIDFYAYSNGRASYDKLLLTTIATCFLQSASELGYRTKWGGNFNSFIDEPHIELLD